MSNRTRSDELTALTSIAAQVNCTQDLDEILSSALTTTLEVIGEGSGAIFLLDEESGQLQLHTYRGLSERFIAEEATIGPGECICGTALTLQQPLVVEDLAHHPDRSRPACLTEGFDTCIHLPLRARGEVLGLLSIQSRHRRHFTEADQDLLTAIGNQIGIAIANARLIKDAEHRRAVLDSVMTSLVDGLVLVDRRGQISYVNPQAEKLFDLPAHALLNRTLDDLQAEIAARVADPENIITRLQQAAAAPQDAPSVEIVLTDPTTRTLQARFFPIHQSDGGQQGLGLLIRDITREKELDRMKSQLLATVSHELRTPLASIKGFATTLLRRDVEWDEESRREFLTIIDEESDRLSDLIGDLLDMASIEAGGLRVEPEPLDPEPLLRETIAEFQMMTDRHRLQMQGPSPLPLVLADPRRTRQVLRNLVENAIKYSPDGGPITITARPTDRYLEIRVADQGIGIEAQEAARIFDRFYQIDNAATRQVGGSGLGLSICKAIVEAQGGQIWVESRVGEGSTFFFTLPLAHQKELNNAA